MAGLGAVRLSSDFWRWQWQRLRHGTPPTPPGDAFPVAPPAVAHPAAEPGETRLTWLGHSSFLLQTSGVNLLTDPVLSKRASPFRRIGPARVVPAPLTVEGLPAIHGVVLSHDHYDHLDAPTLRALLERFGADLPVVTPLGYRELLAKLGARRVIEMDWGEQAPLPGSAPLELACLPAQHWTRRGFRANGRLWGAWLVRGAGRSIYFGGDSGYGPAFREARGRFGAPDVAILPIGAYEPRWFMRTSHMNPEEAVQASLDLGATDFVAMHWGTFRLTDEPMLEPPERVRAEWARLGLDPARLHVLAHGETRVWDAGA